MNRTVSTGLFLALLLIVLQAPTFVAAAGRTISDKPRIAVLEFKNKADNQWWYHGGAEAMQDVFVTELIQGGKFEVVEREQLEALMRQHNLTLSGDVDPSTAVRIGRLLGVRYLLTGSVTEYGATDEPGGKGNKSVVAAVSSRLIDTSTGEIVWADEVRRKVSVGGFGGGVDDARMFDKVMKPCIQELATSIQAAGL